MADNDLHLIDTSKALTVEELQELKRLAAMSKSAKWAFAVVLGAASLFGADRLLEFLGRHH